MTASSLLAWIMFCCAAILGFLIFIYVPYKTENEECPECGKKGGMEYNKKTTATQGEWKKKCTKCDSVWYRDDVSHDGIEDVSIYHRK